MINNTDIAKICEKLGYTKVANPLFRIINENTTDVDENKQYRESTKAKIVSKFSSVKLNNLTVFIKPSRPIARLVKWDEKDFKKCNRLEIKC